MIYCCIVASWNYLKLLFLQDICLIVIIIDNLKCWLIIEFCNLTIETFFINNFAYKYDF